ncbi:unnamed protein product [Nezara viridula]|uniref:Neuropeptide n=1 Tax=Nezara viridula TaxID=85310 RepID=A0A9P0HEF4_NEZVI|nr:unnamed protein product [Nezara viridula]
MPYSRTLAPVLLWLLFMLTSADNQTCPPWLQPHGQEEVVSKYLEQFSQILIRFDCPQPYSVKFQCHQCKLQEPSDEMVISEKGAVTAPMHVATSRYCTSGTSHIARSHRSVHCYIANNPALTNFKIYCYNNNFKYIFIF